MGWRGRLCLCGKRWQQGNEGTAEGQDDAEVMPQGTWGHQGAIQRGVPEVTARARGILLRLVLGPLWAESFAPLARPRLCLAPHGKTIF